MFKRLFASSIALSAICLMGVAPKGVSVDGGWIAVPPPGARTTAAYFELKNGGDKAITIKSIAVAGALSAEFHSTVQAGGVSSMQPMREFKLGPNAGATFTPGGMHVMVFGLPETVKPGTAVELTLGLDGGGEIKVPLTARAP